MKISITEEESKDFCGEFELDEWLDTTGEAFGDQFNAQAVIVLTKAVKMLLPKIEVKFCPLCKMEVNPLNTRCQLCMAGLMPT